MIIYGALGKGPAPAPLTPEDPNYNTQQFPVG
jgi:hypothetical protein